MQHLRSFLAALASALARLQPRGPAFGLFCALLPAVIAYRLVLLHHLTTDAVTPFSFVPLFHNVTAEVRCFALDWLFVAGLCVGLGVIGAGLRRVVPERARSVLPVLGWALVAVIALAVGVDTGAHLRALLTIHSGIDARMLLSAFSSHSPGAWLAYAQAVDLVLALLPIALLVAAARVPDAWRRLLVRSMAGLSLACLLAYLPYFANKPLDRPTPKLNRALRWAPAFYTGYFLWRHVTDEPGRYERRAFALSPLVSHGLAFGLPPSRPIARPAPSRPADRYNVVLVIMESTGARYVFDTKYNNPVPMPRLKSLMDGGLRLNRHYAASNTSPRAIFALYTGLYPPPTSAVYVTRPDVRVPGFAGWLGAGYESFFVTASRLQFYLPHALLQHDGLREMYGLENLPVTRSSTVPTTIGVDEVPAVDFFLKRLRRAKEPFFATYYSFAPHFDYYDQGAAYRIFTDRDKPRNRYYNNLRLLDAQIGRIVDELASEQRLDHTVLVFVGDHGEAFGQHDDNYAHAQESFEENLRTPALFYQPRLFPPARIDVPTSHVDLLPTVLDALSIPYDPSLLQGVSLRAGPPERQYVYAWGDEETLTSVDRARRKVQVSWKHDRCWWFDLVADHMERDEHACDASVQPQLDDLLRFWRFQRDAVDRYNDRLAAEPAR